MWNNWLSFMAPKSFPSWSDRELFNNPLVFLCKIIQGQTEKFCLFWVRVDISGQLQRVCPSPHREGGSKLVTAICGCETE